MKKSKTLLIAGLVLSFLIFCGFADENNIQAQNSRNNSTVKSRTVKKKRVVKNRRIRKVTQEQIENLVGNWSGTFDSQPSTLVISAVSESTFQAILTQAGSQIALTGFVDKNTRRVTIIETKVIESDNNWVLGLNNGRLSLSGTKIWGSGKDPNRPYSWSFTKNR
ncbi:hypothetical protein BH10ACI1_BH10ACI1_29390 [soil metagenome]